MGVETPLGGSPAVEADEDGSSPPRSPLERLRRRAASGRRTGSDRTALLVVSALALIGGLAERMWPVRSPLWLDEAQTLAIATQPVGDLLQALRADGSPPLYYVLLHGWMGVFGDSDQAARGFSATASALCLPLAYWVGRRVGGARRDGLVFAAVMAANPWQIRYAGEARMYGFIQLLVLLGLAATVLLIERRTRRDTVVAGAAIAAVTAALLLTHYWAFFLVGTAGLWCLLRVLRHRDRSSALIGLGAMAAGSLLFLPWLPTFLYQLAHTGAPWAAPPDLQFIASLPTEWSGGEGPAGRTLALLMWPLVLLGVLGSRSGDRGVAVDFAVDRPSIRRVLGSVALGTLLLGLGVSWLTGGAVAGRYAAVVVPLALLLLALGLRMLPLRYTVRALAVVVGIGLLAGLTIVGSTKSQSAQVATVLTYGTQPGDLVVFCPDQIGVAVTRRADLPGVAVGTRPSQRDPRFVDWTDYIDRLAAEPPGPLVERATRTSAAGNAVWLVTSGREYRTHGTDCSILESALAVSLGEADRVVEPDPGIFENHKVLHYRPRGGGGAGG